jgi:PAS domain S-box-containing protein
VIWLFDHFQDFPYLKQAIGYWEEGDAKIEELVVIADEVRELTRQGELSESEQKRYLALLYDLDAELTILENNFSATMGEAALFISSFLYWSVLFIGLFLIAGGGFITVYYFRRVNRLNDLLLDTDTKFRTVLDNCRDVIYQMDPGGTRYEYMSRSVEQMLGIKAEELMEEGPRFILDRIHPDDKDRINRELEQINIPGLDDQLKLDTEFRIKTQWGSYIWVNNKRTLLQDENGKPYGIVGNVRDITDRKKYLDQINNSLKEKETLLAEVHHRVKNNLAIVSSLIELQKDGTEEQLNAEEVLQEIQSRIHSIALVHEKLYQSNTFSEINLAEYIEELTEFMALAFDHKKRPVKVEKNLQSVKFDIIHAIPFGLLYNEIINNVYKHAFNGREEGIVKVNLQTEGDVGILAVADNGVGLPDDFSLNEPGTLGMTLINNLSTQLNGKMEVTNNGWTEFKFVFRLP